MNKTLRGNANLPFRQQGMATILIVMLTGMALTITALGVMYSVRTSQEQQVTVHAATHSQAGVWAAAEAVRLYLQELNSIELTALGAEGKQEEFKINNNNVIAKNFELIEEDSTPARMRAEISYTDTEAKATSTLEVIYEISTTGSTTFNINGSEGDHTIVGDLDVVDDAEITGNNKTKLNVIGVLNLSSNYITQIKTIKATDTITVDGNNIDVEELYSNGLITVSGLDAKIDLANAIGLITISGERNEVKNANANGLITISGQDSKVTNASAGGLITISGARTEVTNANAGGLMTISGTDSKITNATALGLMTISGPGTKITNANAGGFMTIAGAGIEITNANSIGIMTIAGAGIKITNASAGATMTIGGAGLVINNAQAKKALTIEPTIEPGGVVSNTRSEDVVTCPNADWKGYTSIIARKSTVACPIDNVSIDPNVVVSVSVLAPTITKVTELIILPPKVDAYRLQDEANYVFSHDETSMRIKIRNINNIPDDDYYLTAEGNICLEKSCEEISYNICQNKTCSIKYEASTWKLEADNVLTSGVLWFEGDLILKEGVYRNSIIASGSISAVGNVQVFATNYSGYNETCRNTSAYPTNICGKNSLKSNSIGNIALLAGGYKDGVFSGGSIDLTSNQKVHGSLLAGDILNLSGDATVRGYITTAGQGTGGLQRWGDNITIDVNGLPASYNPADMPDMGGGTPSSTEGTPEHTIIKGKEIITAKILWSRYL